jgi:ABC-type glucose/galactose transport system permease subunit
MYITLTVLYRYDSLFYNYVGHCPLSNIYLKYTMFHELKINANKTKYKLMPDYQNARQKYSTNIANKSFQNKAQFKYSGCSVRHTKNTNSLNQ